MVVEMWHASLSRQFGKSFIERMTSSTGPLPMHCLILLSEVGNFACLAQAPKNSVAVENGPPRPGIGPTSNELSSFLIIEPIFGILIDAISTYMIDRSV